MSDANSAYPNHAKGWSISAIRLQIWRWEQSVMAVLNLLPVEGCGASSSEHKTARDASRIETRSELLTLYTATGLLLGDESSPKDNHGTERIDSHPFCWLFCAITPPTSHTVERHTGSLYLEALWRSIHLLAFPAYVEMLNQYIYYRGDGIGTYSDHDVTPMPGGRTNPTLIGLSCF